MMTIFGAFTMITAVGPCNETGHSFSMSVGQRHASVVIFRSRSEPLSSPPKLRGTWDEVTVTDPLLSGLIDYDKDDLERFKLLIIERLQTLYHFRQSIESGYILLAGPSLAPSR